MRLARAIRNHLLLPAAPEDAAGGSAGGAAAAGDAPAATAAWRLPAPSGEAGTAPAAPRVVFLPPSPAPPHGVPAPPSPDAASPSAQPTAPTATVAGRARRRGRRAVEERAAPLATQGLALLCRAEDAAVLTAAVGQGLRRLHRVPCAVALIWRSGAGRTPIGAVAELPGHWLAAGGGAEGADAVPRAGAGGGRTDQERPAARPARRLAASLAERELVATAAGRVVSVELPGDDGRAATLAADRARAAAGAAPVVLVVAGPRDDWADAALARCRAVLVAGAAGPAGDVAELAAAGLAARGLAVAPLAVPRGLARPLCARGLLLPAGLPRVLSTLAAVPGAPPVAEGVAA